MKINKFIFNILIIKRTSNACHIYPEAPYSARKIKVLFRSNPDAMTNGFSIPGIVIGTSVENVKI